jgi:hypothetical protein
MGYVTKNGGARTVRNCSNTHHKAGITTYGNKINESPKVCFAVSSVNGPRDGRKAVSNEISIDFRNATTMGTKSTGAWVVHHLTFLTNVREKWSEMGRQERGGAKGSTGPILGAAHYAEAELCKIGEPRTRGVKLAGQINPYITDRSGYMRRKWFQPC